MGKRESSFRCLYLFIYWLKFAFRLACLKFFELLSSVPLNCHACQKGVYTCVHVFCKHICMSLDKNLYVSLLKIGRQHWPLLCIWCHPCGKAWPYLHVTHQKLGINGWGGTQIPCVLWSSVIDRLWCSVFVQLLKSTLPFSGALTLEFQPKSHCTIQTYSLGFEDPFLGDTTLNQGLSD